MCPVYIQEIQTAVPERHYSQVQASEKLSNYLPRTRKCQRIFSRMCRESHIDKRYSAVNDIDNFFSYGRKVPGTRERNELFTSVSREILPKLADKTIKACKKIDRSQVSHLITFSCTGFYNPGPAYDIMKKLGLRFDLKKYNIGFMGCYAAISALRLATDICKADTDAVVLVAGLELCSLHVRLEENLDALLGNSIFSDGAACAVVSSAKPEKVALQIKEFESCLIDDTSNQMAWSIGDHGFEMVLSQYIPKILGSNIKNILHPILEKMELVEDNIDRWAVHPGGRAILDQIQKSLCTENNLAESREIMRQYGNMSSVTILFVLEKILKWSVRDEKENVFVMAFGPGLTAETALMEKTGSLTTQSMQDKKGSRASKREL